jgi:hypothetical protein
MMGCLPLWPTYIHEQGRTLGKTYGIKVRCYWEHPWEIHWELFGKKGNMKKSTPTPPSQNFSIKKLRHFECMLSLLIGYIEFLFPKLFVTIFGLG